MKISVSPNPSVEIHNQVLFNENGFLWDSTRIKEHSLEKVISIGITLDGDKTSGKPPSE